jgi:uncharacterized integral membrane protein
MDSARPCKVQRQCDELPITPYEEPFVAFDSTSRETETKVRFVVLRTPLILVIFLISSVHRTVADFDHFSISLSIPISIITFKAACAEMPTAWSYCTSPVFFCRFLP